MAATLGFVALGIWREAEMVREPLTSFGRATLVAYTIGHHLATALVPWKLSPIYPIHREAPGLAAWIAPLTLLLAIGAARKRPAIQLGLLAFAVLLIPASNVVSLYFEVQDRYLSLPLVGLAFAAGVIVERAPGPRKLAIAVAVVATYGALTVIQLGHWRSDEALWEHATTAEPDAFYAWMKLGELRREEADYDGALRAYERAIEVEPLLALGHAARFQTLVLCDEREQQLGSSAAEGLTQRFLAIQGDEAELRRLAGTMVERGYRQSALVPLGRALDLAPLADGRLGHAAMVQLENGNAWLARFYVERMQRPPAQLVERVREAIGE